MCRPTITLNNCHLKVVYFWKANTYVPAYQKKRVYNENEVFETLHSVMCRNEKMNSEGTGNDFMKEFN